MLIGQHEEAENHPVSGQWHVIGGHLEENESLVEAVKREVEEETGLEVKVHQIVDTYVEPDEGLVRVIFHCEADSIDAEAKDGLLDVDWVLPEELDDELGEHEHGILLERPEVANFIEKLKSVPTRTQP